MIINDLFTNKNPSVAENADLNYIWIQGDFDGDTASTGPTQGSWRDQQSTPVKLTRGRMSNVRPLSGPPPEGGKTIKQAQIPLTLDAGDQKFSTTGVDLQLTMAPNGYVTNGEVGRVRGTAVVKIMRPKSVEEDLTRRGFLRGLGAAALAGAAGGALAGSNDPNFVRKVHDQHNAMIEKNPRYAKEHDALGIYIARGIAGASAENNKRWVEKTAQLLQKYGVKTNEGIAENAGQPLSVQQLATISDEALDNAYGYGRSTPGNTFGWQANLKSAAYAKKIIDQGVTDIEAISDAIHKGWNTTAQAFVQNPDQFDDTAKLAAAGKLQAKLQQRAQLMKQNYAQLPEEEKEKDRVVARALLQAIRGEQPQGMAEAHPWSKKTPQDIEKIKKYKEREAKKYMPGQLKKSETDSKKSQYNRDQAMSYFTNISEQDVTESMSDDMAAMAKKKFPTAYISKDGQEVQKPENWGKRYTPPAAPPADLEKQRRELTAKYPNIDELVRRAELNRDPDYEMADGEAYYAARDAEQNYQKLRQIQRVIQGLNEHKERQNNMRTKEITESQLDEISLDQIGTGIANVIGGVSKAAGAVAGVPQGIGRAVKKGYRGAVQGIGGAADDGSTPRSDVPGAAYGGQEVSTATGMINPATGRAYVPSDFGDEQSDTADATAEPTGARTTVAVQQDIRNLDAQYRTAMRRLQSELASVQNQPAAAATDDFTQTQKDYMAAIGTDQPAAGSASAVTAAPDRSYEVNPTAPSMARDPKVLNTLQAMNAKELQIIKKILQARARATNESELSEVAFGDVWRGTGDQLKNATSGIRSAASGAASAVQGAAVRAADMAKSAYKTAKPYVKKAGKFAAAVPGAVATGAGAVAGGVAGMKTAARKGYAAGQKHVGGGALTMDELQQAIGGMTAADAKQLLMFIKQLEIQNAPAKGKAKPKAKAPTSTAASTTTAPAWTGRQTIAAPAAVTESLTWSRNFDPGMIVYKRMKSGR